MIPRITYYKKDRHETLDKVWVESVLGGEICMSTCVGPEKVERCEPRQSLIRPAPFVHEVLDDSGSVRCKGLT